jgi:ferredoxin
MYSIEVDREGCIACSVCYSTDPTHFEGDTEGKSRVVNGSTNGVSNGVFNDGLIDDARRAESSCPVTAITVKE